MPCRKEGVQLPRRASSLRTFPIEGCRVSAGRRIGGYRCIRVTLRFLPSSLRVTRLHMRCGGTTMLKSVVCPGLDGRTSEVIIRLYSRRTGPCTILRFGRRVWGGE